MVSASLTCFLFSQVFFLAFYSILVPVLVPVPRWHSRRPRQSRMAALVASHDLDRSTTKLLRAKEALRRPVDIASALPSQRRRSSTSTPTSTTGDVSVSSDGGDGFDMDDSRPTFVWDTNISVKDVKRKPFPQVKRVCRVYEISEGQIGIFILPAGRR